jgi:hypothetical protein
MTCNHVEVELAHLAICAIFVLPLYCAIDVSSRQSAELLIIVSETGIGEKSSDHLQYVDGWIQELKVSEPH